MHIFNFLEYIQLSSIANGVTEVQIIRTEGVLFVNVLQISPADAQFPLELAPMVTTLYFAHPSRIGKSEDEIGGTVNTHGRDEKYIKLFWLENPKVRVNLEDVAEDGRIILEWMLGE
jgi:hypothetical protein